ncbi:sensor histidine kinase [Kordia sp. SMS9]|uniref:sensor histidine kinase n=1 Tax=Kordia sp. SMS9 TaxID=2282170 RepID=UPI0013B45366|nr:histidine kinase [Kordia sp. SMS9]
MRYFSHKYLLIFEFTSTKEMIKKAYLKKLLFRFVVITVVFLLVKLTIDHDEMDEPVVDYTAIFYYFSAFTLFMLTWEVNDWLMRREKKSLVIASVTVSSSIRILLTTMAIVLPVAAIIYYVGIFEIDGICDLPTDKSWLRFRIDFFRAALLTGSLTIFNQFYRTTQEKKEIESSLQLLKKEMMTSKYNSLKSQISPHFLFNSLNTLTSLMYEDRDLASDFVARLASCYRYILDNRESDLVSLEKEMQFLDSFIFMMKVRHDGAIAIHTKIDTKPHKFVIPTLSIQMLVENALKHNYYSKEHPITIDIFTKDEVLIVQNNIRKRSDSQESTQLGLANIKKRYAFYTKKEVLIEETETQFKVVMPLLSSDLIQEQKETLQTVHA